jgi:hypothetical protein
MERDRGDGCLARWTSHVEGFFVPCGGAVVLALAGIFFATLAAGAAIERLGATGRGAQ